jgi:hypothetical protein
MALMDFSAPHRARGACSASSAHPSKGSGTILYDMSNDLLHGGQAQVYV